LSAAPWHGENRVERKPSDASYDNTATRPCQRSALCPSVGRALHRSPSNRTRGSARSSCDKELLRQKCLELKKAEEENSKFKAELAEAPLSGCFLADQDELKAKQAKVAAEASAGETWACIGEGCLMLADDDLTNAFDGVDADKDGFISYDELSEAITTLSGSSLEEAQVQAMLNEVDLDGDGRIDFSEFVQAMTKTEAKVARASW